MKRLRVLHNGNPSGLFKGTLQPSPHWMLFVMEDGSVSGEVLTKTQRWDLPRDFKISDPSRLFDIPLNLRQQQLEVNPHCEEIIVSLVEPSGHRPCTFLMSQLPLDSPLRSVLEELAQRVKELTGPGAAPNGGPAMAVRKSGVAEGPPSVS
jgi:hypothetical protein